jgi:hypothetical protein
MARDTGPDGSNEPAIHLADQVLCGKGLPAREAMRRGHRHPPPATSITRSRLAVAGFAPANAETA